MGCQAGAEVWGRWCFLHGVWAWAPLLREAVESVPLGVDRWGIHRIPLKVGALGRCMGNAFLAKLCAVGGRTCSMGGCLLGESGCPLRVALWLKTPSQHPQPSPAWGRFQGSRRMEVVADHLKVS